MPNRLYDLTIIGAGAGGLIAAGFAVQLGAKVALVESHRIGGDCTWTGCVPSKALLKVAKVAHIVRSSAQYGIIAPAPVTDMAKVCDYVGSAVQQIYTPTAPQTLQKKGMDVYLGPTRFVDDSTIITGKQTIRSKHFLLVTGARPSIPEITGLDHVSYLTYEQIFDNRRLPQSLIVIGAGPIGAEISQAYQRLGCQVTLIGERLLAKEDDDVRQSMRKVFEGEGIRLLSQRAVSVRTDGNSIVVSTDSDQARGQMLFIATGRIPNVVGLDLEKAGVQYTARGIQVDARLRTTARRIYAAGDVLGTQQFSHYAGWQAFHAVRNILLPGSSAGVTDLVPRVTFTDPEVAHVGPTEAQASVRFGKDLGVHRFDLSRVDRAVCDNDRIGFIKLLAKPDGTLLACTIVAERAGETINEAVIAIRYGLKLKDLASAIHAYPTYSTGLQLLATEVSVEKLMSGASGKIVRGLSALVS
jgi:pyruvate/2-oxoglutarate dehydrogenase complex dihydrolipoamide dehydrogenase (E3) component